MQEFILLTSYTFLFFALIYKLIRDLKNGWTIETFFISLILLFYVFIPITIIIYNHLIFQDYIVPDLKISYNYKNYYSYMSFFTVIIFIASFYIGKVSATDKKNNTYTLKKRRVLFSKVNIDVIIFIAYFLSILSFFSLIIYVYQFGGIKQAISYSYLVRSGYGEEVFITTKYVFVKRFIYFSLLSLLIYFFIENKKNIFNIIFLLIIPLTVTLFSKIFLFSGKQGILALLLIILFYFSVKYKKPYFKILLIFLISLIILLPLLDFIFVMNADYYKGEEFKNKFDFITFLGYFSFPQVSLHFAINNTYDYFGINDFIYGLRGNIVPKSWLTDFSQDTMLFNTQYFYGFSNRGIVPPGIIAFAFYSLGIIGVFIVGFISGFIIKKLDTIFQKITMQYSNFGIFYAFSISLVFTAVRTGIPVFNFYNTLFIIFILTLLTSFSIKKSTKA